MQVDHIFIFSKRQGHEADELVRFGFIEGSSNVHPGQGTRNRKFYFENFFLEIVWVVSESELTSALTSATRLWERANHKTNGSSPFGLCLVNSPNTDHFFSESLRYRPGYMPSGLSFDIITNEQYTYLPWTCRLPSTAKNITQEPKSHLLGIKKLTKVRFGIKEAAYENHYTELLSEKSNISFHNDKTHSLILEFDHNRKGKTIEFSDLQLAIKY